VAIKNISNTIAFISLFPAMAVAQASTWEIVPDKSNLKFTATQNGAPVTGKFTTFSGEIQFDKTNLATSHVKILVDTSSVTTGFADIAETLKTSEWFDVKLFPQAIFEAKTFTETATDSYEAKGTLTIRDKSLPVTLSFQGKETSDTTAQVNGKTLLKRTQFDIGQGEWASTGEIKDDVQVEFELMATKK
jgi:polyisoprenoid-binding protein YceI